MKMTFVLPALLMILLVSCATDASKKDKDGSVPQIFVPTDKGDATSIWSLR